MVSDKIIGLRFCLEGGAFLNVAIGESEAKQIIHDFASGAFKLRDKLTLSGEDRLCGAVWALRTEKILLVHTTPTEQQNTPSYIGQTNQPQLFR